jgi:hypothetical protein
MAFSAPVVNEGVKVADFNGHLLIVTPVEYKTGINTVNGVAEAIEVNVVDLDTNEEHLSLLWFNVALRNALKPLLGQKVLGRIGQGAAKPGKNPPWLLIDATGDPAAVAKANAYIAGGIQAPAPVQTASGAGSVTQTATAPVTVTDISQLSPEIQALIAQTNATIVK